MRFAIDAHTIGCRLTGNEVYVRNLLAGFDLLEHDAEFLAYVAAGDLNGSVPPRFARRDVSRSPWLRLGFDLTRNLLRDRPDLLHVQYTAPLRCPVPVVVTVHDVSFEDHPEFFPAWRRRQLRLTVPRTLRMAAGVITGSEFSRRAMARAYGLKPAGITVVPNGVSPVFRPLPPERAKSRVASGLGVVGPFVLTVGEMQPRKNQIGLIHAFAEALRLDPRLPHTLVITGKETWFSSRVRREAERSGVSGRIRFTGFVSDEDLIFLYNACDLFVLPSFYEGFGLPLLEAMACGKAVACSNASALPEVAGRAAVLFDPHNSAQMGDAILRLLSDRGLRRRMERLGLARAAQFSWRETARRTLEVYYSALGFSRRQAVRPDPASVLS